MIRQLLIAFLFVCTSALPVFAQNTNPASIVKASLLANHTAVVAGEPLELAVFLEPQVGWHTYWENPGDAGMPPQLEWHLPQGFSAGNIDWPVPSVLFEGPLATYSYPGSVFLPVTITVPEKLSAKTAHFRVKAQWLVCKDICIPESQELTLDLPIAEKSSPGPQMGQFMQHHEQKPIALEQPATYRLDKTNLHLSVPLAALPTTTIESAQFMPRQENIIQYAAKQKISQTADTLHLTIAKANTMNGGDLSGILVLTGSDGKTSNIELAATYDTSAAPAGESETFLPLILLFALLGGLVLNLMPCVLPVLSLKALEVAGHTGASRRHIIGRGLAYTAGILLCFAVIAGVLISLQHAGEAVGWGYQMQSPVFVGFLSLLLLLVGLNLSGFFELPVLLGSFGSEITHGSSLRASFATGMLATAVATPCTAPFMASAVGAALTLPAWQAMLVFEALGLGLALPFLLISFYPKLLAFLPKPGAWMEHFRQLLAFPMYGSVLWLVWVLTLQTGAGGMVTLLTAMLLIILVVWLRRLFAHGSRFYQSLALVSLLLITGISLSSLSNMAASNNQPLDVSSVAYTPQTLADLRAQGKPVFVDATAAWCITCQVNARVALHTERTMRAFREQGITLMIADWTRPSEEITAWLAGFGRNGVPLNVYYPPHGEPVILPQLLTEDIIINTINP